MMLYMTNLSAKENFAEYLSNVRKNFEIVGILDENKYSKRKRYSEIHDELKLRFLNDTYSSDFKKNYDFISFMYSVIIPCNHNKYVLPEEIKKLNLKSLPGDWCIDRFNANDNFKRQSLSKFIKKLACSLINGDYVYNNNLYYTFNYITSNTKESFSVESIYLMKFISRLSSEIIFQTNIK